MSHFKLFAFLCFGLYLAECLLWVWADGWLFLSWRRRFSLVKGPAVRFRNPWTMGFTYKFRLSDEKKAAPSLSLPDAQARWAEFQNYVPLLNWLCRGILLIAVSAFFLYALRRGFALAWGLLSFFFVLIHLSIVQTFWRAFRKLYPGRKFDWIKGTLLCLFSPWQSARSLDLLGDSLMDGFHPLVPAKLFLEEETFLKFARLWLLELRYPDLLHRDEDGQKLYLLKTAGDEEKSLSQWLAGLGVDLSKLLKPLEPSHESHRSYCQRCDVEYGIAEGKCGDCGRDLIPFKK